MDKYPTFWRWLRDSFGNGYKWVADRIVMGLILGSIYLLIYGIYSLFR